MKNVSHSSLRWQEIQSRFDEVVELDPDTRATRLLEIALEDLDLEREIRLLLQAYERTGNVLGHVEAPGPASLDAPVGLGAGSANGPYEIFEEIGRGGMGIIYRARDTRLGRQVALKFLSPHTSINPSAKARFMTEAKAASALDHPNICTIHEAGETDDARLFIAMAFYEGVTLSARIADGPLPLEKCLSIAGQVAGGLACAHEAGIVHRDIKPSNVMLTNRGGVKILDFGLAKLADASEQTRTGTVIGTAAYMSPEQTRSETVDHRSDLWSLGVLLYEMVTGRRPFRGANEQAIIFAIRNDEPERVASLRPELSASFDKIIHRLLEKNPSARYADASELGADIQALLTHGGLTVPWARRAARILVRKRPVVVSSAAALMLMVIWMAPGRAFPEFRWSSVLQRSSGAIQIRQVWTGPGMIGIGSPSPDGRFLSFTDWATGDLAIRNISTGEDRRLTQTENPGAEYAHRSVISPDGRLVAYSWMSIDGWYDVRVIRLDGTGDRIVYGGDKDLALVEPYDWSYDSRHILAMVHPADGTSHAALISVEDGSSRIVKQLAGQIAVGMALSPDGRYIAFDIPQPGSTVDRDVYLVDVDTGIEKPLVSHPAQDFLLGWQQAGDGVLFASDRTGTLGMWHQDVTAGGADGEPVLVRPDVGWITPIGFTREGSFFYKLTTGGSDVYTVPLDPKTGRISETPLPVDLRFTGLNSEADWSPDGTRLAYVSRRGFLPAAIAPPALVIRSMATGEETVFYPSLENFRIPQWSPDGRTILLQGDDGENDGFFLLDPETGDARFAASGYGGIARWSPGGEFIFISALTDFSTGSRGLVKHDIDSGNEETVLNLESPPDFGPRFSLSPDGQSAVFPVRDYNKKESGLLVVDLADGQRRELIRVGDIIWSPEWSPDGKMIYFLRSHQKSDTETVGQIWRIPAEGGEAEFTGSEGAGVQPWIRFHPDGRQLAFTAGESSSEIWVMENSLN